MVFEANSCTHVKPSSDGTVAEVNTRLLGGGGGARGSMPYVFVRENAIKYWCTVQGGSEGEEEDPQGANFLGSRVALPAAKQAVTSTVSLRTGTWAIRTPHY